MSLVIMATINLSKSFDLTVKVGKNEPRVNVVDHAELQEYVDPMVYCEDDGTYSPTK